MGFHPWVGFWEGGGAERRRGLGHMRLRDSLASGRMLPGTWGPGSVDARDKACQEQCFTPPRAQNSLSTSSLSLVLLSPVR